MYDESMDMKHDDSLVGQVALVTGGSGGLGQSMVRSLAGRGAKVVVHFGGNSEGADEVVREVVDAGGTAVAVQADLTDAKEIVRLYDACEAAFGKLDIVVNNAGVGGGGRFVDMDLEALDRLLAVNFRAVVLSLSEAGKRMNDGGAIVNVSSMLGDYPLAGTGAYSATKAAVDVLSRTAAKEFGERGISVNSLSPGATLPGMFGKSAQERQDAFAAQTPLGRLGKAEDLGEMVAFLVSGPGKWINGSVVTADGGYSA